MPTPNVPSAVVADINTPSTPSADGDAHSDKDQMHTPVVLAMSGNTMDPNITLPPRAASKLDDLHDCDLCPPFVTNPPARTTEPFRDFNGPFTIYRTMLLLWLGGAMVGLYYILEALRPRNVLATEYIGTWIASPFIGIVWLVPLPASILAFIGAMWYHFDARLDDVMPVDYPVVFRIVSRGLNPECLIESIRKCQHEMRLNAYFPYLIEVVTEADSFRAPLDPDVIHLRVPPDYATPNGTLFKARALHYASQYSVVPGHAWLVHLDEETRPTPSGIKGICKMIDECERKNDLKRVGQGTILYHRAFKTHKFLTLADMRRTGDDFGHFHLQHRLGRTIFGFHGAFIVCRQDTETTLGFDVGPAGSITEDAWWILVAMKDGYRTKWVEGYLDEQATQSIMDFLKQRRRWMYGLMKVVLQSPASWPYRIIVGWFVFSWMFVPIFLPLQIGYMVALYVLGLDVPQFYRFCVMFIVAMQICMYLIGWFGNVHESDQIPTWQVPFWTLVLLVLTPLFQLLEMAPLVMAFFAGCTTNGKGFHIVQKSATKTNDVEQGEAGMPTSSVSS